ncbi:DUF4440 domain-containing protein [Roseateles sp.]|uniref:DUF4440 domain-containing protein n=1 Tax=Roseateles sp. TaxID=1971397 RepID=UPI0037CCB339
MTPPDLSAILDLERQVWEAAVRGDPSADESLIHESFLGVYSTGFAGRQQHVSQLNDGPVVSTYEIQEARLVVLKADVVMLAYLARFRTRSAPVDAPPRRMYVSSLWQCYPEGWLNVFSQDTGAA